MKFAFLLMLLCAVASAASTEMPQHRSQQHLQQRVYHNGLRPQRKAQQYRQHSFLRPRIFSDLTSNGVFGVGVYLAELLAGTMLALLVLYLVSLVYGLVTGKKTFNFTLEGRSSEDVLYAFDVAQQVYQAIENFRSRMEEENI